MTTSTRTPIRVTCVGIVSDGRVIPVTDQKPVTIEDQAITETHPDHARELIPVSNQRTNHTLEVATLKATITTLLDTLDEMEQ